MNLTDLTQLAQTRRAVRHFRPDPIPEALLTQLLDTARWSPSGYNLQPTHFVTVTKPRLKPPLAKACLHQSQILEAPATVIFVGDRRVARNHLEKILHHDRLAGGINDEYEKRVRSFVSLAFDQNPMGLGWLWKSILPPVLQLFRPMPSIPAVHKSYWIAKQVMLSAMLFMLAATAAGLATCPMEGMDPRRVRRVLGIPRGWEVCLVIPIGYADDTKLTKTRLPLKDLRHHDGW